MKKTRRRYSREFKLEAVRQLQEGRRLADVARELEVDAQVIRRWVQQVEIDAAYLDSFLLALENDPDVAWVEPAIGFSGNPNKPTTLSDKGQLVPWGVERIGGGAQAGDASGVQGARAGYFLRRLQDPGVSIARSQSSAVDTERKSTPSERSLRYRWVRSMPTRFASLPTLPSHSTSCCCR